MEFRFILDKGNTFKELLKLNRAAVKRSKLMRILVPLLRIVLVLGGIFFLVPGIVMLSPGEGELHVGIACLAVGVIWLLLGLFYFHYGAWRSRRMQLKNIGSIIISLTENDIVEVTQKTDSRFGYDVIQHICFYKNTYFLFVDKKHAFILPCGNLVSGNLDDLQSVLEERCGRTVQKL